MKKITMKEVIEKKAYTQCFYLIGDKCSYPAGATQNTGKVIKHNELCPYASAYYHFNDQLARVNCDAYSKKSVR